ncbi:MAG: SusD/RagB family nutrient-binding outer membrane lipoprotein [Saprospirales bacterium]|nr:SusD/RagB family nutrient-binding outer membrane lipoprotein [Saprospirales bacterium]
MKKLKYLILALFMFGALSCGDKFGDINVDPNNPSLVPADFLLTSAQKAIADDVWDEWMNARFGLLVAQYWAQNNYTDESRYNFRTGVVNSYFASYYVRSLRDLEEIKKLVTAGDDYALGLPSAYNKLAVAEILQCWMFHFMTDVWGPIPYSEALKGGENRTPKYDSQKDIYLSLLSRLEKAKADIDTGAEGFGSADIIYGGDMGKWKRFAASMILRVAMRMSDVEASTAKAAVEGSWQDAFSSNDDNAYFYYLSGQPNNNPLNQDRIERGDADFCTSSVLVDKTLVALNDPRVEVYVDSRVNGDDYFGRPFGQTAPVAASEAPEDYCQPSGAKAVAGSASFNSTDVLAAEASMIYMNYAEVCFILAEAKERTWNVGGTAADWYDAGITASMNEWGITDEGAISDYLGQASVDYAIAPGDWKQKIGVQKWLALYMQGVQGWSEWRRLDFNKFEAPVGGAIGDVGSKAAPVRLTYPTDEQTQNGVNYTDAVSNLLGGPDKLSTRLWWDVQ